MQQILNLKDLVCELHFKKDDIIKEEKFTLPDGSIRILKKKKFVPCKDAVPFIEKNNSVRVYKYTYSVKNIK